MQELSREEASPPCRASIRYAPHRPQTRPVALGALPHRRGARTISGAVWSLHACPHPASADSYANTLNEEPVEVNAWPLIFVAAAQALAATLSAAYALAAFAGRPRLRGVLLIWPSPIFLASSDRAAE